MVSNKIIILIYLHSLLVNKTNSKMLINFKHLIKITHNNHRIICLALIINKKIMEIINQLSKPNKISIYLELPIINNNNQFNRIRLILIKCKLILCNK